MATTIHKLKLYAQTATFEPGYYANGNTRVYDPTTRRPRVGDAGEAMTLEQARETWKRLRRLGFKPV